MTGPIGGILLKIGHLWGVERERPANFAENFHIENVTTCKLCVEANFVMIERGNNVCINNLFEIAQNLENDDMFFGKFIEHLF